WRDEAALAFGLSHRVDQRWSVRAGGTYSQGGSGFNAGVGMEF
ncbi:MAG: YadA C-terminal domain-containing protein, partial [Brevundimonas sp.]